MKEYDEDYVPDSEDVENMEIEKAKKNKKKRSRDHWKRAEEMKFLKEMVRYFKEKKCDPSKEMDAFLIFKKAEVGQDFSESQLKDKITSLKKRFDDGIFSQQKEMLNLSESIWGGGEKAAKSSTERRLNEYERDEDGAINTGHTCFNDLVKYHTSHIGTVDENFIVEAGLDLIEEKTLQEWDQQWQEAKIQQMIANATAAKAYNNQMQALVDALKK